MLQSLKFETTFNETLSCFEFGGIQIMDVRWHPLALGKKAAQIVRLSFAVFDSPMIDQGEKRPMQSCLKLCDVESINASVELSTPNSACPQFCRIPFTCAGLAIRAHEVLVKTMFQK